MVFWLEVQVTREPDSTDKHVGTRIRTRRVELGLSQSALADALGITFQQIQKYEKGSNRVSASRLQKISDVLQVQVSFFFDRAGTLRPKDKRAADGPHPAYVAEFLASREGLSLAKSFIRIKNSKFRNAIVRIVADFAACDSP
jgi:transcriptional regulator with XRE-family HTH domain